MWHLLFLGVILGWGAAIPIGPMNLEMARRNLRFGTSYGFALGLGACTADLTYIVLITSGALVLLHHPLTLKIVGVVGAFVLAWFGLQAIKTSVDVSLNVFVSVSVSVSISV